MMMMMMMVSMMMLGDPYRANTRNQLVVDIYTHTKKAHTKKNRIRTPERRRRRDKSTCLAGWLCRECAHTRACLCVCASMYIIVRFYVHFVYRLTTVCAGNQWQIRGKRGNRIINGGKCGSNNEIVQHRTDSSRSHADRTFPTIFVSSIPH